MKFLGWLIVLNKIPIAMNIQRIFKSFLLPLDSCKRPTGKNQTNKKQNPNKESGWKTFNYSIGSGSRAFSQSECNHESWLSRYFQKYKRFTFLLPA